jgi:hypothetical protein
MDTMDYINIRAWGQFHRMSPRWINDELQKARDDKAPGNVVFKADTGEWMTIEQVGRDRVHIEIIAGNIRRRHNPQHMERPDRRIM